MSAFVTNIHYRGSPHKQGGLEIPIKLHIHQADALRQHFEAMTKMVDDNYTEPGLIRVIQNRVGTEDDVEVTSDFNDA